MGSKRVQLRHVALDSDRRQAMVPGTPVDLTKQEFDLLYLFGVLFGHRLQPRGAAVEGVERRRGTSPNARSTPWISRLRRKVERGAQDPEMILTAWGVGYKFVDVD